MADISHQWGEDIRLGATDDLLLATGSEETRQRVLRRLLSNEMDLLFHPTYGAGLPRKVGETTKAANLEPTIRRQMFSEAGVQQEPPPNIKATPFFGGVTVAISYQDAVTQEAVGIGFTIEG